MRGDAEGDAGNFFQEKRGVRCAVGEMDVKVIHAVAREKVREVDGVTRTLIGLDEPAVFPLVKIDKCARPLAVRLCIFFPDAENLLRRRVVNRRAQPGDMLVPQTGERRIN